MRLFSQVEPTQAERSIARPGDALVEPADVVMDRAFTLDAPPEVLWPWLAQLGKHRAGWYFPRWVERFVPRSRRALRTVDPQWQQLAVGDVIPDYGGKSATFEVFDLVPARLIVYRSIRGHTHLTWVVILEAAGGSTRVSLRLRLAPVNYPRLAGTFGGFFDLLTIAGLAAGLRERLREGS